MGGYEIWKYICLLVSILYSLTSGAKAEGEVVAAIEKSLHEYYQYVDGYVWKWMTWVLTCDRLGIDSHRTEAYTTTTELMLESEGCIRLRMETLTCVYKECLHTSESATESTATTGSLICVRGVNGEIYEIEPPGYQTKCDDRDTPIVKKCIHTGKDLRIDFSEVEELFCKNREFMTSEKWENEQSFCELACPENFSASTVTIDPEIVLVPSTHCLQIQMNVLKCTCLHEISTTFKIVHCVKGIRGEVYKVSKSFKGNEPETFYIRKRIIDFEGRRVQPLCHETTQ